MIAWRVEKHNGQLTATRIQGVPHGVRLFAFAYNALHVHPTYTKPLYFLTRAGAMGYVNGVTGR